MTRLTPLLLLPLLVACKGDDGSTDTAPLEGDAANGAELYTSNCSSCHGADGEGSFGPALQGLTDDASDAELSDVILNGEGEDMPGFNFTDQEVADVIAHMATF